MQKCVTLFRCASSWMLQGQGDDPVEPAEGGWTLADILDGKTWIWSRPIEERLGLMRVTTWDLSTHCERLL